MKILLTRHKGYIGAVASPMLAAAGHQVTGLGTDLFAGVPEIRRDFADPDGLGSGRL